jgi:hypothetical protein
LSPYLAAGSYFTFSVWTRHVSFLRARKIKNKVVKTGLVVVVVVLQVADS